MSKLTKKQKASVGKVDPNKLYSLEDAMATDDKAYNIYFSTMLEDGIIVPPSKYEAHFISWAHNEEDFEKLTAGVEKSFAAISGNLG